MPSLSSITIPPTTGWTKKSDSSDVWIPITAWYSTEDLSGVRPTVELRSTSGSVSVKFGYQMSDDQVNTGSPVPFGTARTSEGLYVETSYTDITADTDAKLFIRFGLLIRNQTSGTTLEMCRMGGRLDFK